MNSVLSFWMLHTGGGRDMVRLASATSAYVCHANECKTLHANECKTLHASVYLTPHFRLS